LLFTPDNPVDQAKYSYLSRLSWKRSYERVDAVTYGANARANVRWKAGLSVRNGTRNEANDTTGLITAVELSHFETQLMIFLQQLAE
jgi:hypothetical protein